MTQLSSQLVLKEGPVFLMSDDTGNITGETGQGLYYHDVRHLSFLNLQVNGTAPSLLSATSYRNFMGTLQLTNGLLPLSDGRQVIPQTVSIRRSRFVSNGLRERIGLVNYNPFPLPVTVPLAIGSDFRDIFDIRGFPRRECGTIRDPEWDDQRLTLAYDGLAGIRRLTIVTWDRPPEQTGVQRPRVLLPMHEPTALLPIVGSPTDHNLIELPVALLTWHFALEPHRPVSVALFAEPVETPAKRDARGHTGQLRGALPLPPPDEGDGRGGRVGPAGSDAAVVARALSTSFDRAVGQMRESYTAWSRQSTDMRTDNEEFNRIVRRSMYDLRVLSDEEDDAYFPSAGIPWFVCPFGRDSLITSLQTLALNPRIAVGTLRVLAKYQGERVDPRREEQPGKILHELRRGEMANLGLVPHNPYYGTADATPLFVMLFTETMRWLNDDELYRQFLPHALRAIRWIDEYGDLDGDGFVEYAGTTSPEGIRNQVWKDSEDSIQFPDGRLAEPPIAAVEVQGYVYAAKQGLGELLRARGEPDQQALSARLLTEAAALRRRFNEAFWLEAEGCFAQGLDRAKRPVPAVTSNPGHCLWTGIAEEERAQRTIRRLMAPDMLSGWGLRTLTAQYPAYNPMSYHNGSIWPHDNSIVAAGFKRYGCAAEALQLITQVIEAAEHFRYFRLPELYCGFGRDQMYQSGPADYPVSCSPQAWAAATPILMLQTILGLHADAGVGRVQLSPALPPWLTWVELRGLLVGRQRVDLRVEQHGEHVDVALHDKESGITLELRPGAG